MVHIYKPLHWRTEGDEFAVHVVELEPRILGQQPGGVADDIATRLASPLEPLRYSADVVGRAAVATHRLLLPQLTPRKLFLGLTGSRIIM